MSNNDKNDKLNNKTVVFRAPVLSVSGYGVASRQVAVMLHRLSEKYNWDLYFEITPWGKTPFLINDFKEKSIVEKHNKPHNINQFDISFQHILPNEFDPKLAKYNVGITAGVETDICNPEWVNACNNMDIIFVPSNHTKNTFKNSGPVGVPIYAIGHSYDELVFKENFEYNYNNLEFETDFNFLSVGQLTGDPRIDRKNIFLLIKTFCEAFSGRKDVGLVLKTNSAGNSIVDKVVTTSTVKSMINSVRPWGKFPKVHLVHGYMSDVEMAALYNHPKIKAFVMPTRGEGFCIPVLEAAVSGLPVMVTDWSGHKDIIDLYKKSSSRLPYSLVNVPKERIDNNIFVNGAKWAEVDINSFKSSLYELFENHESYLESAKVLSKKARGRYALDNIFNNFEKILTSKYK